MLSADKMSVNNSADGSCGVLVLRVLCVCVCWSQQRSAAGAVQPVTGREDAAL